MINLHAPYKYLTTLLYQDDMKFGQLFSPNRKLKKDSQMFESNIKTVHVLAMQRPDEFPPAVLSKSYYILILACIMKFW